MNLSIKNSGLRIGLVGLFAFVLLAGAAPARAADFRTGERVVIEAGEVIDDDLFVSAETVIIDGTVTGDLIATGTNVVVNGLVEGSAMLAGQTVSIDGDIDGSLYGAGYVFNLKENATVGRNFYGTGWSLSTAPGSEIGTSAYLSGYQFSHEGSIGQDLAVALNAFELAGTVGGDVTGQVDRSSGTVPPTVFMPGASLPTVETMEPGLRVDPTAVIGGEVAVESISPTVQVEPEVERGFLGLPEWVLDRIGEFIGLLIIGAALIYFLPRLFPRLGDVLQHKPLPSFGWGALIALVAVPVGLVVGLVLIVLLTVLFGIITFGELIGAVLSISAGLFGLALLAFLFVSYILAKLIVSFWVGRLILSRALPDTASKWAQVAYLALGLLLFEALRAIPTVGWLLSLLVMFLGLGVVFVAWLDRRRGVADGVQKPLVAAAD